MATTLPPYAMNDLRNGALEETVNKMREALREVLPNASEETLKVAVLRVMLYALQDSGMTPEEIRNLSRLDRLE